MKNKNAHFISLILIILLVAFDQLTKKLAVHFLAENKVDVIPGIFSFTLLEGGNSGAAFGLLKGGFWFFVISTVVVLYFSLLFLRRIPQEKRFHPLRFSIVLLISGAIGNFIDRISTMIEYNSSFVVDFLFFEWIDFPIFNVADCYITVSAFLLIIFGSFYYKEDEYDRLLGRKKENPEK